MSPPRLITGLSELTGKYDAFIFDLWGVIHDGKTCYPGVAPSFHALREAGKKIGIISNSPRPAASAADNIRKFGLTPDMYDVIMTSGQLTYEALRDRPDPWLQALGRRCVHFGPPHEFALYAPLGLREAATPQDADFILATGVEDVHKTLADYDSILKAALEKKLPLLCANPDLGVSQEGRHKLAAGSIAHHYADMGGDARVPYGKPHPAIFHRTLEQLGVAPDRAVMIGDNLLTDIAGAHGVGMATLWIHDGVHRPELGEATDIASLRGFLAKHDAQADYILPSVTWS